MEELCHSVSKMIHKIPKPSKKTSKVANPQAKIGKVFSSPSLLQLPSGQQQQSAATQKRSKSTSHIADKEYPTLEKVSPSKITENIESPMQNNNIEDPALEKVSPSKCTEIESRMQNNNIEHSALEKISPSKCTENIKSRMQRNDMANNNVDLKEKPIYENKVFANGELPKITTGKQKKIPPKRPPPPKVLPKRYQDNVYANLQRSKSDSQMTGTRHVYANYDEKLDTRESVNTEDLNIYINQVIQTKEPEEIFYCNQYEGIMTESLKETYISMTGNDEDEDEEDEDGYVMMSRDRSMTS